MAVFYPNLDQIRTDTMEKHTTGELSLLEELEELPDDYNVYYQAHINCAHPDVVVECAGCGILIIEVKDWNLASYTYHPAEKTKSDKYGYLMVAGRNAHLATPFEQVQSYKDELFEVLSPELCAAQLQKEKVFSSGKKISPVYGVVKTCVYFSTTYTEQLRSKFGEKHFSEYQKQLYYDRYIACITADDKGSIASVTQRILCKNSNYTKAIHEAIKSLFAPSMEWLEQTTPIQLTEEQNRFAQCNPGRRTRILGTPGSGKTLVIAQKAINCYLKKHEQVLILTFNITLKNYIRDKIAVNSRSLSGMERSKAFEILHLDQFLPQMLKKYELKKPSIEKFTSSSGDIDWDGYRNAQMQIILGAGGMIERYSTVLIDEAQDFAFEWFKFIDKAFIGENADYLVVADEKQNIYGQKLDDQRLPKISGFRGPWAKLKGSHRMTMGGYHLAVSFQQEFMKGKYTIDEQNQLDLFSIMEKRKYVQLDEFNCQRIFEEIRTFKNGNLPISPNDICILVFSNADVRSIDQYFRTRLGPKSTQTVCETAEAYKMLRKKSGVDEQGISAEEKIKRNTNFKKELNEIRHVKRSAFNMNPGTIKISTVHSFKGWEINTIVLVIHEVEQEITPEVIYTAITRTKGNLLIINCGNHIYHDFFEREINADL